MLPVSRVAPGRLINRKANPASDYAIRPLLRAGTGWNINLTAHGVAQPVGSVKLIPSHNGVYISDLRVAPEHRRQGLATRLVEAALQTARTHGYGVAQLEARPDSPADVAPGALVAMYRKMGFRTSGISTRGNPLMERRTQGNTVGLRPSAYHAQASASQPKMAPPPVYRPQSLTSQPKMAAPPVYRPQSLTSQQKRVPIISRPRPTLSQPFQGRTVQRMKSAVSKMGLEEPPEGLQGAAAIWKTPKGNRVVLDQRLFGERSHLGVEDSANHRWAMAYQLFTKYIAPEIDAAVENGTQKTWNRKEFKVMTFTFVITWATDISEFLLFHLDDGYMADHIKKGDGKKEYKY
jgi:GNAT superfamily N-acetyltransferase